VEAQQLQLRDGFTERDNKIRMLNEALSRALTQTPASPESTTDDARAAREALTNLDRRLSREITSRERLERRLQSATYTAAQAESALRDLRDECEGLRRELTLLEGQLNDWLAQDNISGTPELSGAQVLYVGGRAHQVPQLRAVVELRKRNYSIYDISRELKEQGKSLGPTASPGRGIGSYRKINQP
jgi:septal ring factor EnvC (AmiA/AmiB activator)